MTWHQSLTLWFSKQRMYLWAVTQFEQRKLAQSLQRATAFSSALQLVQRILEALMSNISIAFIITTSSGSSNTPPTWVPCLQVGHTRDTCSSSLLANATLEQLSTPISAAASPSPTPSLSSRSRSRQPEQNICKQFSTRGCWNRFLQIWHKNGSSTAAQSPDPPSADGNWPSGSSDSDALSAKVVAVHSAESAICTAIPSLLPWQLGTF